MAYEKQTWECGDVISADKMNHMEDGIAGGDPGYECADNVITVYDESINVNNDPDAHTPTDSKTVNVFPKKPPTSITVIFDGQEYEFPYNYTYLPGVGALVEYYGGNDSEVPYPAFGDDPLVIQRRNYGDFNWTLYVKDNGEHTVKISYINKTVTTSDCFKLAVDDASNIFIINPAGNGIDKTQEEIDEAFGKKTIFLYYNGAFLPLVERSMSAGGYVYNFVGITCRAFFESDNSTQITFISANIQDGTLTSAIKSETHRFGSN